MAAYYSQDYENARIQVTEMKIGIQIEPQMGYTYEEIVTLAKAAKEANFYSFTVSDHFFGNIESVEKSGHDAWTLLALLTPQTERIRLGTLVTSQSYRNPALVGDIPSTHSTRTHFYRWFIGEYPRMDFDITLWRHIHTIHGLYRD